MRLVDSFLCAITACVAATASAGAPPLVSDAEALVAEMRSDAFATSAAGLALEEGKWNKVRVVCDRQSVFVEVNGVKGEPAKVTGYSVNPVYTAFGATPGYINRTGAFFNGRIRSLSVRFR